MVTAVEGASAGRVELDRVQPPLEAVVRRVSLGRVEQGLFATLREGAFRQTGKELVHRLGTSKVAQ